MTDDVTATQPPAAPDATRTAGPDLPAALPFAAGELLASRYRLLRPLGQGGMGAVFLAEQTDPVRREVAVKLIRAGRESAAILARFEAERQALALMTHPHIARVFDGGTAPDGSPFVVMEYVPGEPITDFAKALPLPDRLRLFTAVCEAVQHAHQKGVIHRDLKPSNVLVAEADGQPVPKVIDFGIAKATGGKLTDAAVETAVGAIVGTPAYMAPEQAGANPEDVDTRADVYALGVLLYELLTGTTPIPRDTLRATPLVEILRMVREDDPPPPSRRAGHIPRELDWVVMRALAKERDRRYGSAAALAADVRRFLANEPVEAGPPSRWYRWGKFVRRNRVPVAAGAVVLLALVGGIAGTTWGMVRANDEAKRTEAARQEADANLVTAQAAEKARRVELGKTAGLAAELAARQGKWEEAIRLYDRALAQEPEDEVGLRLGKLGCLLAQSRFKDARDEIDALAARPDLGRHRGRVLLERAEAAMYLSDYGDSRDLARQALDAGLSPADAGYARVFLAETVPEAIAHLKEAVRHDPFHRSGPQMLATLLFLSGRVAEMREVVAAIRATRPDSVALYQMDVFVAALDRDRAALDRAVGKLAGLGGGGGVGEKALRAVAEILMLVQDEWFHVRGLPPDRIAGLTKDWLSLAPEMGRLMGDPDPDRRVMADMAIFRLPLFRGLADLPLFKTSGSNPLAAMALLQPATLAELLGAAVRANPEGTFLILYGGALERSGKFIEAEEAFRRAVDAPAWSNHRRAALYRLLLVQRTLGFAPQAPLLVQLEWRGKARATAWRLAGTGPLPPDLADQTAMAAYNSGDPIFALAVTEAAAQAHPQDRTLPVNQVYFLYATGAVERAEAVARGLLVQSDLPAVNAETLLNILSLVAVGHRLNGAWAKAERVARLVLDERQARHGTDHPAIREAMGLLADVYFASGRPDQALPLVRESVAISRRLHANDPVALAGTLAQAGSNLLQQGQPKEAEPILREALALRERHLRPTNWAVANARSMLGGVLAGQKRYAEAEPLLLAGYDGLTAPWAELIPTARGNIETTARRLVDLYTAWGKPEEAAKWRQKLPPEVAPPPRRVGD